MNHTDQVRLIHEWPLKELKARQETVKGVIHVGAHFGQESPYYDAAGITRQVWVEPVPQIFQTLMNRLPKRADVQAFMVACAAEKGRRKMEISSDIMSQTSSLRSLKRQVELHPKHRKVDEIEVDVTTLDVLLEENKISAAQYDLLVVDTQGSELDTLKGALKTLDHMRFVVAEVGTIELYEGMPLSDDVDCWMKEHGFSRIAELWFGPARKVGQDWINAYGDALYARAGE